MAEPMTDLERIRPASLPIRRPARHVCDRLAQIGTATISSELNRLGMRDCHIVGPQSLVSGRVAAGPALTLQFMPKREDLFVGSEYDNPDLQLHRHVMYPAEAGDMLVVDARADMRSGIFGEMMLTYLAGSEHADWEEFSRQRLSEGGDMRLYQPLSDQARPEYEAWRRNKTAAAREAQ